MDEHRLMSMVEDIQRRVQHLDNNNDHDRVAHIEQHLEVLVRECQSTRVQAEQIQARLEVLEQALIKPVQ